MNLQQRRRRVIFVVSVFLTFLCPALAPGWRLSFFVPYLVVLFYQTPLVGCLWRSIGCGLLLDLLSSPLPFGFHALNFTLTTVLLYNQKRHFFADRISTLPLMTFLYSCVSGALHMLLFALFTTLPKLSAQWVMTDLLLMPLADGVFAFVFWVFPLLLIGKRPMRGQDYFQN